MAETDVRTFVADPTPAGMDPETAEWLLRQFERLSQATGQTTLVQEIGGGQVGDLEQQLNSHIQNQTNPHQTRHDALADGGPTPIEAHVIAGGTIGQVLGKASNADFDLSWTTAGGESKGEQVPGTGAVHDDVNAHCFVGDFSDGSCRLCINPNDTVTIGHNGTLYRYIGPNEVCIGSGGAGGAYPHRVTVAGDFFPISTSDHSVLDNRDAANSHPQAAVTDLVADQQVQDNRLTTLEAHPPRTDNPHSVSHAQLPDRGLNTHVQIDAHIASTTNPHSVRHSQLPDQGTNDHAAIDAHIADLLIHFQDVPLDGVGYLRRDRAWAPSTNMAILQGTPANGGLGTGGLILVDWNNNASVGVMAGQEDPLLGTITIPETSWYRVVIHVHGDQGNDTKEESIWLDIEATPSISWSEVCHESVDTDKTSSRTLSVVFTREFSANDVLRVRLRASTGLGTFNFAACTFEVAKVI